MEFTTLLLVALGLQYASSQPPSPSEQEFCTGRPSDCDTYCQYGYKRSPGNVCTCSCFDPCQGKVCNPNEVCIVQRTESSLIAACRSSINQCPYGVRVNVCFISPCLLAQCSIDRTLVCIPDYCGRCAAHFFERSTGRDVTLARCRKASNAQPTEKTGTCPRLTTGLCLNECNTDADCEGAKKCCSNGCGRLCVSGVKVKPGACPLIQSPPGQTCQSNCQSDDDCDGSKKCCFNGCGNVCSESEIVTTSACTKLKTAIESLPTRSVLDGHVPACESDGRFKRVQCDRRVCWCVDGQGQEIFGTKSPLNRAPDCDNPAKCQILTSICTSDSCPYGFKTDETGCPLSSCECVNYCHSIRCPNSFQTCRLVNSDCDDGKSCPPMPQCLANPCPGGHPQIEASTGLTLTCHQAATDRCDANHWCHMIGFGDGGLCCPLPSTAVRSGKCPAANPSATARCVMECTVDADCPITQKCCYNGCGLTCTPIGGISSTSNNEPPISAVLEALPPPALIDPPPKPGSCPKSVDNAGSLFGHCSIQCKFDADCKGDEKCCKFGCNFRCAGPAVPPQELPGFNEATTQAAFGAQSATNPVPPLQGSLEQQAGFQSVTNPIPVLERPTQDLGGPAPTPPPQTGAQLPEGFAKVGECPQPLQAHSDVDQCSRACQTDGDCVGVKKCCFSGCGTRCMYPLKAPLCIHLSAASESVATTNLGVHVPKCQADGRFEQVQCSTSDNSCWCVDQESGRAVAGTRASNGAPDCQRPRQCPKVACLLKCLSGYKTDGDGCFLCRCQDPCETVKCSRPSELCVMMPVQCQDAANCGSVPRCVVNSCPSGSPGKDPESGQFLQCASTNPCPSGFWCHNIGLQGSGVCCPFPVRQVHPGQCPSQSLVQLGSGGACFSECLADDDCLDTQKCCFNGCGLSCVAAARGLPNGGLVAPPSAIPIQSTPPAPVVPTAAVFTEVAEFTVPSASRNFSSSNLQAGIDPQVGRSPISDLKLGVCPRYNPISRERCATDVADCSSDDQCAGSKKCCNDGCVKRCMYSEVTTACLHAKAAIEQFQQGTNSASLSAFIPQCRDNGDYERYQCDVGGGFCWCVDQKGFEIEGTRVFNRQTVTVPSNCESKRRCPTLNNCQLNCPLGQEFNDQGCPICRCRNPCQNITCPEKDYICVLAPVECSDQKPCPPVPRCIANACPHGSPILNGTSSSTIACRTAEDCGSNGNSYCQVFQEYDGYCCPSPQSPTRPGRCPGTHISSIGSCRVECRQDSDCPVSKKCCSNGCGLSCLESSEDQNEQDGQSCPASVPPFAHCVVECQGENDCRPGYKCCANGCSRTCVLPADGRQNAPVEAPGVVKVGICPSHNRTENRSCAQQNIPECSSDVHCLGARKCCFDGCANYCTFPKVTTGCLHQQAALTLQLSETPDRTDETAGFLPQCNADGSFERIQCNNKTQHCWCLDGEGMEIPGTRTHRTLGLPPCDQPRPCQKIQCTLQCPFGFKLDNNGCETCACDDPCEEINCSPSQICRMSPVECIGKPCMPVPKCTPNPCTAGEPLKNDHTWEIQLCDASGSPDQCPNNFFCQITIDVGAAGQGACCPLGAADSTTNLLDLISTTADSSTIDYATTSRRRLFAAITTTAVSTTGEEATTTETPFASKIGICPSNPLSNPGCATECNSDTDCVGTRKCCVFGCGRKCQVPQNNTACLHWKAALESLSTNDSSIFIAQCDRSGDFEPIQCSVRQGQCWCVDPKSGVELIGTRTYSHQPSCTLPNYCNATCQIQCQHGLKLDAFGCPLDGKCECKDPCQNITCSVSDDICLAEKRTCFEQPCPPVPSCKPNPCLQSHAIRDKSTGQLLLCVGRFNHECGGDVCTMIPGHSFGLCCLKTAATNLSSPILIPAADGIASPAAVEFPTPPDFHQWHQMSFFLEGARISPNESESFRRTFLDQASKRIGLETKNVRDFKLVNNIVTLLINGSATTANASATSFNFAFNGATYTARFESMGPSQPNQWHIASSMAPTANDDLFGTTAFIGLVASSVIFGVIVTVLGITACCIFRRKRKMKKTPRLSSTVATPCSYSAALYTTHSSSSEIGRPILETCTDLYNSRSLPRKKYFTDREEQGRPSGNWHATSPRTHRTGTTPRSDNQLYY